MSASFDARVPREKGSDFSGENQIVHVIVGLPNPSAEESVEVQRHFYTSKVLLSARSHFFRRALYGEFKESKDGVVTLEDQDPCIFNLYFNLIHLSQIPMHTGVNDRYSTLMRLYVLCEMLQDRLAKNIIISAVLSESRTPNLNDHKFYLPSCEATTILYDGTPRGSLMRKLVVDFHVEHGMTWWLGAHGDDLPNDFLRELSITLLSRQNLPSVYIPTGTCEFRLYHEKSKNKERSENEERSKKRKRLDG